MSPSCKILLLISLAAIACGKPTRTPKTKSPVDENADQVGNAPGWTDPSVRPPGSSDTLPPGGMPGGTPAPGGGTGTIDPGTLPGPGTLPVPGSPGDGGGVLPGPGDTGDNGGGTPPPAGGTNPAPPAPTPPADTGAVFPGASWQTADPADVGLNGAALKAAVDTYMRGGSTCIAVVKDGYLVASAGTKAKKNPMSVGKSVLSSAIGMLFTSGKIKSLEDAGAGAGNTIKENLQQTISGRWNYSPTGAQSNAAAIVRKYGGDVKSLVFDPLGMKNSSISMSSGFMDSNCEDLARWGHMLAQGGVWNGQQLINEQYMRESVEPVPGNTAYGYLYWLNHKGTWSSTLGMSGRDSLPIPGAPESVYYGKGFGGQIVLVYPEKRLVVVRLGNDALLVDTMGAARKTWEVAAAALQ